MSKAAKTFLVKSTLKLVELTLSGVARNIHPHDVCITFQDADDAQNWIKALNDCVRAAKEIDEPDERNENSNADSRGSVGPFSYGTGSGKRNIRGTNSLT